MRQLASLSAILLSLLLALFSVAADTHSAANTSTQAHRPSTSQRLNHTKAQPIKSYSRPRFEDLYACYIICDAEATGYDDDEYEQIDYEDFLNAIRRSRYKPVAFERAWQVHLFDDDGIRYTVYVSRSCRFVRVDADSFQLTRRAAKRLKTILP